MMDSAQSMPSQTPQRRVCMITHSFYETDNRVIRYAETLAARGDHVDVLALRRGPDVPEHEVLSGAHVWRLQMRMGKTEQTPLDFLLPILKFLVRSSLWLRKSHRAAPYDVIHVHNVPDFLVFAAWHPKLKGAGIILDIHDIVPEFFASKFGASDTALVVRMLRFVERLSARFADHVILANDLWLEKYTARSAPVQKCSVFINNVNTAIFYPRPRTRNDGKQIILFPGGLQWHQGVDIAISAFNKITDRLPNAEFHIYGDGNTKAQLLQQTQELGLQDKVKFFPPLPVRQIAEIMANADLGVVPKRANSFGNEAYSTKIMEFMSLGVPVAVSETKIDRFYFNDNVVRFFPSGDANALAIAIVEILTSTVLRENLICQARNYACQHNWETRKTGYLKLVDYLSR